MMSLCWGTSMAMVLPMCWLEEVSMALLSLLALVPKIYWTQRREPMS